MQSLFWLLQAGGGGGLVNANVNAGVGLGGLLGGIGVGAVSPKTLPSLIEQNLLLSASRLLPDEFLAPVHRWSVMRPVLHP